MAANSWLYGVSGDWSNAFDWSAGAPNNSTDSVSIATAGVYTVTIGATENFSVGSVNLDYTSATLLIDGTLSLTRGLALTAGTLDLNGTLDVTNSLTLTAGTLNLNGTINGGTIFTKSGKLNIQTGVLSGVKVEGEIRLTDVSGDSNLTIDDGLLMTGTSGTGNGTVTLTGIGSALVFDGSQSVDGATISFGSSGAAAAITASDEGSAATLTLDNNVKIIGSGRYAEIFSAQADGAIVNDGSISATVKGGQFSIGGKLGGASSSPPGAGTFTNNGSVSVSNGDTLTIEPTVFTNGAGATLTAGTGSTLDVGYAGSGTFTNYGAVSASSGDTLSIGSAVFTNGAGATLTVGTGSTLDVGYAGSSWSNAGTITATGATVNFNGTWTNTGTLDVTNSTVILGASLTGATLNQFAGRNNSIVISGSVANSGSVLSLGMGTGLGAVALDGGTITGGTIDDAGGGLSFSDATLDGVAYQGALDLGASSSSLTVDGGIALTGTGGSGGGTIDLSGANSALTISGGATLAAAGAAGAGTIDLSGAGGSLSILGGLTLTAAGGEVATIDVTGAGSSLVLAGSRTLDNATINIGSGDNGAALGVSDDGSAATLVLGSKLNLIASGLYASLDSNSPDATILNAGLISATASGGQFAIGGGALAFINTGSLSVSDGDTLTIAASTYSNAAGGTITAAAGSTLSFGGGSWVNAGTVTADGATFNIGAGINTGTLTANGATLNGALTNTGTVTANGATLYLGRWTNSGTVTANGATIYIDGTLTNTGAFVVTGSTVNLGASNLTDAVLELFGGAGNSIELSGALANGGETLSVGAGTALGMVVVNGGKITGGTIADSGGGLSITRATLTQVAYQGALDLSAAGSTLTVNPGVTFTGAGGSGPGTIDLTGARSSLNFAGGQMLSNATIDLAGAGSTLDFAGSQTLSNVTIDVTGAGSVLDLAGSQTLNNATIDLGSDSSGSPTLESSDAGQLTLGANLDLVVSGLYASISLPNATVVNDTAISAAASGGDFKIGGAGVFTNNGSLSVSDGDTIVIQARTLTNLSGTTLTGGTYEADANSTMQINQFAEIVTDNATIILNGAGSTIDCQQKTSGKHGTYVEVAIDSTLTTIGATGVLKLLGGRNFTIAPAYYFYDNGALVLGSSTFTASYLTVAAGASLSGSGVVAAYVADNGLIEASGGTLTLQGAVAGTGGLKIDAGAGLTLDGPITGGTAIFNGANADLAISSPSSFTDTIGGLAATDEIDLLKTAATSAVVNASNQLVVTDNGAAVATFQLSGTNSGLAFTTTSDGNGGTFVVAGAAPAPHANLALFRQYVAAGFGDHAAPLIDRQDHLAMAQPHHDFAPGR